MTYEPSEIETRHMNNDHSLLEKYATNIIGSSGFDPQIFSASFELVGLSDNDEHVYLPHFEFNVGVSYAVKVPTSVIQGAVNHRSDCIDLRAQAKDGELVDVKFAQLQGLFELSDLTEQERFVKVVQTDVDRERLLFSLKNFSTSYNLRVSAVGHGQLVAAMPVDHANAQEVINKFLKGIDEKFEGYQALEEYFREQDESGNKVYFDEQSKEYNELRDKLHKLTFHELRMILMEHEVRFKQT